MLGNSEFNFSSFAFHRLIFELLFVMSERLLNKISCIIWSSLCLILVGCSTEPVEEDFVNVQDQYELRLHQSLSPDGSLPSILVTSVETHNCLNSYISHIAVISEEKTRIYLKEILTEGECISGNEVVSEDILINTSNTALPIEINVKSIIHNTGVLYSNNTQFELDLHEFDGLKIVKTQINRVQPKMLWGSFSLDNNAVANQISDYLNEIDLDYSEPKGDYGFFYVAQDNSVSIYEEDRDFTFLISSDNDFDNFKTKIEEFKQLDPSLTFEATNFDGSALNIQ